MKLRQNKAGLLRISASLTHLFAIKILSRLCFLPKFQVAASPVSAILIGL